MSAAFERQSLLIGDDATERLKNRSVLLFGVGGVGGFVLEGLVRAGVGKITIVDCDVVSESNLNRQIIADSSSVGKVKVEVAASRAKLINPEIDIRGLNEYASADNIHDIISDASCDYVVDAIDTVTSKLEIIKASISLGIPVISSMGTGGKLDPTRFRITDISKTHTCPLAKTVRLKLKESGIKHVDVLFSDEVPIKSVQTDPVSGRHIPGSISFVPSVAGLIIAGHVIKQLIK